MSRRLIKRIGITLVAVVILIIALMIWSSGSNKAAIDNQDSQVTVKHGPTSKQYSGAYMSFTYPSVYFVSRQAAHDDDLELAMLTADTTYQKQLAVAVSKLEANNLENSSAHKLRASQPDQYTKSTITVDGGTAEQWKRHDGTKITVLIPHNSMVASLSFTAIGGLDDLQPEVTKVLTSYHWK